MKRIGRIFLITIVVLSLLSLSVFADNSVFLKNSNVKTKEKSMGIELENYDVSTVHNVNEISEVEKKILLDWGISAKKAEKMDLGDFLDVQSKQQLSSELLPIITEIYPDLDLEKIEKWTYGDYDKHVSKSNEKLFKPSGKEEKELKEKGITLADARYLLKEYATYQEIINATDEKVKKSIEEYYEFKNATKKYHEEKEKEKIAKNMFGITAYAHDTGYAHDQYTYPENIDKYVDVHAFAGYVEIDDPFLKSVNSHITATRIIQEQRAASIYKRIYSYSDTPEFTNLYGTYSRSTDGAHEGLDMVHDSSRQVHAYNSGTITVSAAGTTGVYDGDKTYLYWHMYSTTNNYYTGYLSTGAPVSLGTLLGYENEVGNATADHLHYEIRDGEKTGLLLAAHNHVVDSINPYNIY